MAGIKETKEMIRGLKHLMLVLMRVLSDGVQFKDVSELFDILKNDPEAQKAMQDAVDGYGQIPGELMNLNMFETIALGKEIMDLIPAIAKAIKKK